MDVPKHCMAVLKHLRIVLTVYGRHGGLMLSALDSGASGPGSSPGRGIALCSWAGHFTLTVPLSTQVPIYQWVPSDLMLGVTLRWTSIPSRVEEKCSLSLHATETWISSGLMGHLARMQNLLHSFKTELATDLHPVASYTSTNAILSQFV